MSGLDPSLLSEAGLFVVIGAADPAELASAAARLGIPLDAADHGGDAPLRVIAVGPDGDAALYRLGDRHFLVLALNDDGPVGEAWERLERRVDDAGIAGARARFALGEAAGWGLPVGWGWIEGTVERLTAIARPAGEVAANRFLSSHWPLAWELWREGEGVLHEARAALERLRAHADDLATVTEAAAVIDDLAGNLGRLQAADPGRATGRIVAPVLSGWTKARGELRQRDPLRPPPPPEEDLPYPVAAAIRASRRRTQHLYRLSKIIEAGEAATALGAVVVAGIAAAAGVPTGHEQWAVGNYSGWADLAHVLASRLPEREQVGLADPELWVALRPAWRALVERRNREYAHDPTRPDDERYAGSVRAAQAELDELLRALAPLRDVRLARVVNKRDPRGKPPTVVLEWMRGANPLFEQEEVALAHGGARDDELVIVDAGRLIRLHPFAQVIGPPGAETVGLLAGRSAQAFRYACRVTGEVVELVLSADELAWVAAPA